MACWRQFAALSGCGEWILGEVETVAHPVGLAVAVGKRVEPEGVFAEFEDADVRVHLGTDMARFGVRAQDQARHPGAKAEWLAVEFRMRVRGALGMRVMPPFFDGWSDMV